MPNLDLKRLRDLRRRSEVLLNTLASDLNPFRHQELVNGFRRKPDSPSSPDDVNVTTTCSCLMALAISDKLKDFYGTSYKDIVVQILQKVVEAPWMSSGLSENNAFTTTLLLRLFGCLTNSDAFAPKAPILTKLWEPCLEISKLKALARRLAGKEPFAQFLFQLLPCNIQQKLQKFPDTKKDQQKLQREVSEELSKLVRTTIFYDTDRFKKVKLSENSKATLKRKMDAYSVALLNRFLLHDFFPTELLPLRDQTFIKIARSMSSDLSRFGINNYPPAAAVLYWFVDGIDRANMSLDEKDWKNLCEWAADEFARQRSLVVSKHAAMMDPVAMAMAACLCARIRKVSNNLLRGTTKEHHAMLPSMVELERAVLDLFAEQTASGIWPKYFPLFHYQDAGSNFCFTFEMLEAVLFEFGGKDNRLLTNDVFLCGLERAVTWCDQNRLRCSERTPQGTETYQGWNSGGNLETLKKGQPESWATAVVHMFLWELVEILSIHIQTQLLDNYSARRPSHKWKKLDGLLDIELLLDGPVSLKETLRKTIVKSFEGYKGQPELLRKRPIQKKPLSALLFGPPGTSKTEVAKAIAHELDWPLLEIDPSHFLQDSFQNIYLQAEKIFADMMDLSGVVVLLDEMDALVQKRDATTAIDTESKFLTTYMLPKLAKLHDKGQVVFLMATNFQATFDDAIKRAGRFDFLLCMGPPTLKAKCAAIHAFYDMEKPTEATIAAGNLIYSYAKENPWLEDQLTLYTYGEFLSFVTGLTEASSLAGALTGMKVTGFIERVKEDASSVALKFDRLKPLWNIEKLRDCRRLADFDNTDFTESDLLLDTVKPPIDTKEPVIKYVLERKQTRRQCAKSLDESQTSKKVVVHSPP